MAIDLEALAADLTAAGFFAEDTHGHGLLTVGTNTQERYTAHFIVSVEGDVHPARASKINWSALDIIRRHVAVPDTAAIDPEPNDDPPFICETCGQEGKPLKGYRIAYAVTAITTRSGVTDRHMVACWYDHESSAQEYADTKCPGKDPEVVKIWIRSAPGCGLDAEKWKKHLT